MSNVIDINAIARRLKTAQDENRQIEPISDVEEEFDFSHAYEVAHRLHEARIEGGAAPVGRKIGFTNSNIWDTFGVAGPIWGYVYDTTVTRLRDQRGACSIGGFVQPHIEPEIVVHFHSKPDPGSHAAAVLGCIDWVAHGFEIVQCHFPGWRFRAPDTVADSALHGALLLGEPVAVGELGADPAAALASFSVELLRDGEAVETGSGSNVLGSPLKAVAHLVDTLAGQPSYPPLQSGEIVTTGTLTGAYPLVAGEVWSTEIEGIALPGLTVEIEA